MKKMDGLAADSAIANSKNMCTALIFSLDKQDLWLGLFLTSIRLLEPASLRNDFLAKVERVQHIKKNLPRKNLLERR